MTTIVTIALAVAVTAFALSTLAVIYMLVQGRREERRWHRQRERIAAHQEHLAAQNGRPHTSAVTRGTRRP